MTPVTTTVISQQLHGVGTLIGTALAWPEGASQVEATGVMSAGDAANPSNTLTQYVAASYDGGKTFTREGTFRWGGGFGVPDQTWMGGVPTHVRVEIDLPQPLSAGWTMTLS